MTRTKADTGWVDTGRDNGPDDPALARFLAEELGANAAVVSAGEWAFTGAPWVWRGGSGADAAGEPKGSWHFLTIDGDVAAAIRSASAGRTGGFGSVKVEARIGATRWRTSLFPSKDAGGYLLPLKAAVRRAAGVREGAPMTVSLTPV